MLDRIYLYKLEERVMSKKSVKVVDVEKAKLAELEG